MTADIFKDFKSGGFDVASLELEGHAYAADDTCTVEVILTGDLEVLDIEFLGKAGNRRGQLAEDRGEFRGDQGSVSAVVGLFFGEVHEERLVYSQINGDFRADVESCAEAPEIELVV